jgi:hypothetical protein
MIEVTCPECGLTATLESSPAGGIRVTTTYIGHNEMARLCKQPGEEKTSANDCTSIRRAIDSARPSALSVE